MIMTFGSPSSSVEKHDKIRPDLAFGAAFPLCVNPEARDLPLQNANPHREQRAPYLGPALFGVLLMPAQGHKP